MTKIIGYQDKRQSFVLNFGFKDESSFGKPIEFLLVTKEELHKLFNVVPAENGGYVSDHATKSISRHENKDIDFAT